MKRTIEIEDNLQERVSNAIDEVKQELLNYLGENPDTDKLPCIINDLDYFGAIHEIVDINVPIYSSEIRTIWYLYEHQLCESYHMAGAGDDPHENDGMSAIYFYIHQKVCEWYNDNADDIFDEWLEAKQKKDSEEIIKSYEGGVCPDCQEEISKDVEDGDSCENCSHVFYKP